MAMGISDQEQRWSRRSVRKGAIDISRALSIVLIVAPFAPVAASSPDGSEDGTVIRVAKKHRPTKGWSRGKYGGPGSGHQGVAPQDPGYQGPANANDDDCRDAPGDEEYFWRVFRNDHLQDGSEVLWDDPHGRVELAVSDEEHEHGFLYRPNGDYSQYQFPYRIVSPDNPDDYADATVSITFEQAERTC